MPRAHPLSYIRWRTEPRTLNDTRRAMVGVGAPDRTDSRNRNSKAAMLDARLPRAVLARGEECAARIPCGLVSRQASSRRLRARPGGAMGFPWASVRARRGAAGRSRVNPCRGQRLTKSSKLSKSPRGEPAHRVGAKKNPGQSTCLPGFFPGGMRSMSMPQASRRVCREDLRHVLFRCKARGPVRPARRRIAGAARSLPHERPWRHAQAVGR